MTPVVTAMDAVTLASGGVWTLRTLGGAVSPDDPLPTITMLDDDGVAPVAPSDEAEVSTGRVRVAVFPARSLIAPPAAARDVVATYCNFGELLPVAIV